MLICDKCGVEIPQNSKFCPQCGDPVDEKDIVAPITNQDNISKVFLTFGYSSSVNYEKAISICKKIPTYTVAGENKKVTHSVTLDVSEIALIENLYNLVGSWKSSKMLIGGKSCTKKDLVYYGLGCFRGWQNAINKTEYCYGKEYYERNIWGCKKLDMPIFIWGGGWLEYGGFDDNGIWYFNKERIKHELDEAINKMSLCPILSKKRVYDALALIPDKIDPKTNPNWEYDERLVQVDGKYKKGAKGIKPTIQEVYYMMPEDEQKPSWDFEDEPNSHTYEININLNIKDQEKTKRKLEQNKNDLDLIKHRLAKQEKDKGFSIWTISIFVVFVIAMIFLAF